MTLDTDINEHFEIPDDIKKLAERANYDLYHGPTYLDKDDNVVGCHDPEYFRAFSFSDACDTVRDWCGDNISDMYYDADCGQLMDSEPQGDEDEDGHWIEPSPYSEVSRRDIKVAIFGREMANYI